MPEVNVKVVKKPCKTNDYQLVHQIVQDLGLNAGFTIGQLNELVELCNEFHKRKSVEAWEAKQK